MDHDNTSAFYRARYDEVWRLFEEDQESDAYLEPCAELLRDEYLPLAFRVTLQYLHYFASDHPELDLQRALEIHQKIEDIVRHEQMPRIPWMDSIKEMIDEELNFLRSGSDERSLPQERIQLSSAQAETEESGSPSTSILPARETPEASELASASGSNTLQPEATTISMEPTLNVSGVDESKEMPSSPIVHAAVQQMEDDAEMLLMPSSPVEAKHETSSYADISNLIHASTAPRRVDDTILKRALEESDDNISDDGDDDDSRRKRTRKDEV